MINDIEKLPKGCVTRKTINGKIYHYHQWSDEEGKMHYDSVSEAEAQEIKSLIEKRKQLEKETKRRNYSGVAPQLASDTGINAVYGDPLGEMASLADGLDKRDCFAAAERYLYGPKSDKVCLLYGLRRTGKTTILRQLIRGMSPDIFSKAIYIKATVNDTMAGINHELKNLIANGYAYIFIDEVTLIDDFVDSAALFSDVYAAQGVKIILSGTDSLGFYFASNEELYDRAVMIHTTFIPFGEHARLLGIDSIDEYIRYGGTLKAGEVRFGEDIDWEEASFRDDESTRRYIDTAICRNIQHSLNCYEDGGHFRHLKTLYDRGELTGAINRIIQDMNHEFTADVILREFRSRDLGSAAQLLRKAREEDKRTNALDYIDTGSVLESLKRILEIKEKEELETEILPETAAEIREYLEDLDLIEYVDVESASQAGEPLRRTIFVQPGMRYCQAQALVYYLMRDPEFKSLSEREKTLIAGKILEDVRGIMLEDIVLLETRKAVSGSRRVFKLQFDVGEIDMVIYDPGTDSCQLYEIKHSDVRTPDQWKNIDNADHRAQISRRFGNIAGEYVLYRGETCITDDGREYRNVEEYLKSINLL